MFDQKKYDRDYYKKNRDKRLKQNSKRQKENLLNIEINHRNWHHERRMKAFELLGGKCVRCGETDWRCLQIDHINGGGHKHFSKRGTIGILDDVLKDPDPKSKYQLLCANCNWIKRWENKEHGGHPKV